MPTIGILGRNGDTERVSTVLTEQSMPVIDVEFNRFFALAMQVVSMTVGNDGINEQCRLICHIETEWSYIHGNSDTEVIRIDLRQNILLLGILDSFGCAAH